MMKMLQEHEVRKLVKDYQDRHITVEEFKEELEWYWDRRIYKGTKTPLLGKRRGPEIAILGRDGITPQGNS